VHNQPLAVTIDQSALLAAVDRIYTQKHGENGAAMNK
jgi:hypothetical protein